MGNSWVKSPVYGAAYVAQSGPYSFILDSNCVVQIVPRRLRCMQESVWYNFPVDISTEATSKRNWAELPEELLEQILSHLYGEDVRSFHSACRSWHAAEECVFQKEHNPLVFPVPHSQWLLHRHSSELTYQFIHPAYPNVRYAKNLGEETDTVDDDAIPLHSKDGWLLMSSGQRSMFFFSPFPKKVIKLPDLIWNYEDGVTFTCAPTSSSRCVVFVIEIELGYCTRVIISTIRLGKKKWKKSVFDNDPFRPSFSNPVFHEEMFYCLSKEGKLGVYNPMEDTWSILEKPLGQRKWAHENYLVEHEGGLMSVFVGDSGSWISVSKLNKSDMVWENVYSLEEYALFVSVPTSFATKSVLAMMKNKIFFPWLHNNYPVFYCLETKTFRTYGSDLEENNLYRTEIAEQIEACWIEPREICCLEEEVDWLLLGTNVDDETDVEIEYETDGDDYEPSDRSGDDDDNESSDRSGGGDDNESSDRSNSEECSEEETNNKEEYEAIDKSQEELKDA